MHAVAIGARQFDHVAGAEIVDGGDLAQHPAFAVARFQPDQVGVIEFVFLRRAAARRAPRTVRVPFSASAALRSLTPSNAITASPSLAGRKAVIVKLASVLGVQHAIARQGVGRGGEDLRLHLALQALRAHDGGEKNVAAPT